MFEPVAVIGMSCNFPGARNYREYWENLCGGVVSYGGDTSGQAVDGYRPIKGQINDPESFQPSRHNIGEKEAELMDPQTRKFIELVDQALVDAGYGNGREIGCVGVIASQGTNHTYHDELEALKILGLIEKPNRLLENVTKGADFLATRISYHFNWSGPSFNLQAGCSSSLVSVVEAVFVLQSGRCDAMVAGGINITYPLDDGYEYERGSILSESGVCRPFDSMADGTIPSNGGGVVILKTLLKATQDGDRIHAVIRAAGTNNDGRKKVSFAAPSVKGQYQLLKDVYSRSGINPTALKFIECHATGTVVGDPIEVRSIGQLLDDYERVARDDRLLLGSVKGNLGHLFWSSGMASLIKAILSLKHGIYPGTANFDERNPLIDLDRINVDVSRETCNLTDSDAVVGGVSSFGVGGTNAHVVLARHLDFFIPWTSSDPMATDDDKESRSKVYSLVVNRQGRSGKHHADVSAVAHRASSESGTVVQKIVDLYESTLGTAPLNADSDYFDLYGDSVTAVALISDVKRQFMVDISFEDIFDCPTPKLLAKCIEEKVGGTHDHKQPEVNSLVAGTNINAFQSRFYLLEKLQRGNFSNYNVAICLDIDDEFDRPSFLMAVEKVLREVPIFRRQAVWSVTGLSLGDDRKTIVECDEINIDPDFPIREQYDRIFGRRFNIETGGSCRLSYVQRGEERQVVVSIPHLMVDGKGMDNLLKAVGDQMSSQKVVSPAYHAPVSDLSVTDRNRKFWIDYLAGFHATALPYTGGCGPRGKTAISGEECFRIDSILYAGLRAACSRWHVTPYVLMYSVFNLHLAQVCGTGRVCTGTTLVNRNADTVDMIGCFINNIPVAVDMSGIQGIADAVDITRRRLASGIENSHVPFDVIVSDCGRGGTELYRILFMFQNQNRGYSLSVDGRLYQESAVRYAPLYGDICVNVVPVDKEAWISVTYDTSLYSPSYIREFCNSYLNLIDSYIGELGGSRRAEGN